jgi:flavorubredoxin
LKNVYVLRHAWDFSYSQILSKLKIKIILTGHGPVLRIKTSEKGIRMKDYCSRTLLADGMKKMRLES